MRSYTPDLLARLGVRPADAADLQAGLNLLTSEDEAEIGRLSDLLQANVGRVEQRHNPVDGDPVSHPAGVDYLLLLALIEAAPSLVEELMRRGVDEATAWRSASDLGQQVHVHRLVHGRFGFGGRSWVPVNYSGSLLWLGRLQFTLEASTFSLACHIPECGPLSPDAVDDSLAQARTIGLSAYREFRIERFMCTSWLLDPGIRRRLPQTSNVARFSDRFERDGEGSDGRRDALYFGFHRETGQGQSVELGSLPQETSLQRAIVAQLGAGGVRTQPGWFPVRLDQGEARGGSTRR